MFSVILRYYIYPKTNFQPKINIYIFPCVAYAFMWVLPCPSYISWSFKPLFSPRPRLHVYSKENVEASKK